MAQAKKKVVAATKKKAVSTSKVVKKAVVKKTVKTAKKAATPKTEVKEVKAVVKSTGPIPSIEELLAAGVHFGHTTKRWHPAMATYIYKKKGVGRLSFANDDQSATFKTTTKLSGEIVDSPKGGFIYGKGLLVRKPVNIKRSCATTIAKRMFIVAPATKTASFCRYGRSL